MKKKKKMCYEAGTYAGCSSANHVIFDGYSQVVVASLTVSVADNFNGGLL